MDFLNALTSNPEAGMALAAGLLKGDFGGGLLGFSQTVAAQKDRAMKNRLAEAQLGEISAQTQQRQAEAARQMAAMEQQRRIQAALQGFGMPRAGTGSTEQVNAALPAELRIGAQPALPGPNQDFQALIKAGVPIEQVKALAEAANYGRAKVARTVEGMNAQGQPVTTMFDDYGQKVGEEQRQWKAPVQVNQGNKTTFLDQISMRPLGSFQTFQSPDNAASVAATMRGQDLTDRRARETNDIQRNAQRSQIIETPNGPILVDKGTGGAQPVMLGGAPVKGEATMKRESGANQVLALLDQAEKALPQATNSFAGAGLDLAARGVGWGTDGAQGVGKLKAIEGALLGQMPRMEGPQSNYDVQMYKQAAGQLGDPTVPNSIKMSAIATIREIQQRYAGQTPANTGGATGDFGTPSAGRATMRYNASTGKLEQVK